MKIIECREEGTGTRIGFSADKISFFYLEEKTGKTAVVLTDNKNFVVNDLFDDFMKKVKEAIE